MNHKPRYNLTYYVYENRFQGSITFDTTTVHLDGFFTISDIDGLHEAINRTLKHLKHVTLADPIHGPFTAYRTYEHDGLTVITLFHGLSIADIARQVSEPITLEQAHERVMYGIWTQRDITLAVHSPLLWNLLPLLPYQEAFMRYRPDMAPHILIDVIRQHEQPAMDCLYRDFPSLIPLICHLTDFLALPYSIPIHNTEEDGTIIVDF